ncbi:unnamed protein product [Urochloa decumbens]|uniref:Uncharacterized protein n=1 Tax=Urochloa decumbens TaxID=240449 RepID=A0ABC9EW70_9POAL
MERTPVLCLLITMLAFYLLVPSSAVPLSTHDQTIPVALAGLQKMPMQEAGQMLSVKGSTPEAKMKTERFVLEDDQSVISERMAFETQDYGPPGPNNHHKPPGWR